jgi:2-dehydro-3-deoxygalactonokinase
MLNSDMIISCDWGSSRFRMRLVDCNAYKSIKEIDSDDGIATLNYKSPGKGKKEKYLLQFLQQQANELLNDLSQKPENICIVLSGMASSTIGIRELPYAPTPFSVSGTDMVSAWIRPSEDCGYPLLLLSGIATGNDVMRGEETQLIGLQSLMGKEINNEKEQLYIFPGTHSKHINIKDEKVQRFSTFMTGELFALLSHQSILRDSVAQPQDDTINTEASAAFEAGMAASSASVLTNTIFSARTNILFNRYTREQNYYFLSGVLIGTELKTIQHNTQQLFLCAGSSLQWLYSKGLESSGLDNIMVIPAPVMDIAAVAGHVDTFRKRYHYE